MIRVFGFGTLIWYFGTQDSFFCQTQTELKSDSEFFEIFENLKKFPKISNGGLSSAKLGFLGWVWGKLGKADVQNWRLDWLMFRFE